MQKLRSRKYGISIIKADRPADSCAKLPDRLLLAILSVFEPEHTTSPYSIGDQFQADPPRYISSRSSVLPADRYGAGSLPDFGL